MEVDLELGALGIGIRGDGMGMSRWIFSLGAREEVGKL